MMLLFQCYSQIHLCIIRTHTTEEKTTLRDICVGKDASKFIALVERFMQMTPECETHNAITINIGQNRKPLIDIILERGLNPRQRLSTYTQIAMGMKFLHDHELIHCSLQAKYVYASVLPSQVVLLVYPVPFMFIIKYHLAGNELSIEPIDTQQWYV